MRRPSLLENTRVVWIIIIMKKWLMGEHIHRNHKHNIEKPNRSKETPRNTIYAVFICQYYHNQCRWLATKKTSLSKSKVQDKSINLKTFLERINPVKILQYQRDIKKPAQFWSFWWNPKTTTEIKNISFYSCIGVILFFCCVLSLNVVVMKT